MCCEATITKRAVAWVGSVQPECTVPLSTRNFRNLKPEFLLNGKRPDCYPTRFESWSLATASDRQNVTLAGEGRYFCPRFARFGHIIVIRNWRWTHSTSSVMFVTGIMRLFRSNCPPRGQNGISLAAAKLCRKSKACSLPTAWERLLKRFSSLALYYCFHHQNFRSFIFHYSALCQPNLSFSSSREVPVEGRLRISN